MRVQAGVRTAERVHVDLDRRHQRDLHSARDTHESRKGDADFLRAPPGPGREEVFWKGSTPFQVGAANPIEKSSSDGRFGSHSLSLVAPASVSPRVNLRTRGEWI